MRFDDLYDERRVYEGAEKKPLYEQEKVVEGYKSPTTDTTPMNVQRRPVVTDNKVVESVQTEVTPDNVQRRPVVTDNKVVESVQTEVTPDNVQRRPGFEEQSKRVDWWDVPSYTAAVEEQRKKAEEAAALDVKRSKRKRDVALIGDMADVLARSIAHHGSNGAWMYNPFKSRSEEAQNAYENALKRRDGMAVDYAGRIAQAKMQDYLNRKKQEQAEREYGLKVEEARRDAEKAQKDEGQRQFENAMKKAELQMKAINDEENRKSREKIASDNRASSERIARERNESYERTYGRRNDTIPINLGDGEFTYLDKKKWTAANKPAIAKIVEGAILSEINKNPDHKAMYEKYGMVPIEIQQKIKAETLNDLSQEKLFNMWREFPASLRYVLDNYGVDNNDHDATYYNQYLSASNDKDKEYFNQFTEE